MGVIILMVMTYTSCNKEDAASKAAPNNVEKKEGGQRVTDALGRNVIIPENPQRVIALTSAAMDALINIGIMPIAKIDDYKIKGPAQKLPSVGKASDVNIEAIYGLKPDLIIAQNRKHARLEESLQGSGASVYFFDPDTVGTIPIIEIVQYFGNFLHKEKEGTAYVEKMFKKAKGMAATLREKTGIKTAVIIMHGDTVRTAINASGFGSMLQLLEIKNIVPDGLPGSDKGSFVIYDMEEIIKANPDLVLVITNTKDKEANKKIIASYKKNPLWAGMITGNNTKIIPLPFSVNPNRSTAEDMLTATYEAILKLSQ